MKYFSSRVFVALFLASLVFLAMPVPGSMDTVQVAQKKPKYRNDLPAPDPLPLPAPERKTERKYRA